MTTPSADTPNNSTRLPASSLLAALYRFYAAEEHYTASPERDFGPIAETIHPDIVLYQADSLPYGGEWRGHVGIEKWLRAMTAAWRYVRPRQPLVLECGTDTLVSLVTMEAEARDTGRSISMPVCQYIRFSAGLPIEWRVFYWDTAVLNQVLGHRVLPGECELYQSG